MLRRTAFFVFLSILYTNTEAQTQVLTPGQTYKISIPLFGPCKDSQKCESGAVCKFSICLPNVAPTPVIQPAPAPPAVTQPITPVVQPMPTNIHTVKVSAPVARPNMVTVARPVIPQCLPKCVGTGSCSFGVCVCPVPTMAYNAINGCTIRATQIQSAQPVPVQMRVPQALPGDPCAAPNVECSAGSVCSQGICECPPELMRDGAVCVSPAIFGLPHRGLPGYANIRF